MQNQQTDRPKLSPKEYSAQLKYVELESIALVSCSAKIRHDKLDETMRHIITDNVKYKLIDERSASFEHEYQFVTTKSTKRDFTIKIICVFNVQLSSENDFSEEFLEIFSKFNLHINTWPYYREFVQNIIQRMGLPPLTLPLLKK